jgi:hypothetical protein
MKRTALILTLIVIAVAVIWVYPAATFKIDDSWWIVRYNDQYDIKTAELLQDAYGCEILDIEGDHDFNTFGQSFAFIGGSQVFAQELPWAEWAAPDLWAVTKPTTQPDIRFMIPSWDGAYIETPNGNFYIADGDYGFITKAYDVTLRRWIILFVGWSAECTAAGTRILIMHPERVNANSYIIYEYTGGTVALNSWRLSAFSNYEIVATS